MKKAGHGNRAETGIARTDLAPEGEESASEDAIPEPSSNMMPFQKLDTLQVLQGPPCAIHFGSTPRTRSSDTQDYLLFHK